MTARHTPVLLAEVLECLAPADGETIIDGTFGAGGYTSAILEAARCSVIAVDRDPRALAAAAPLAAGFAGRLTLVEDTFSHIAEIAAAHTPDGRVDGVVLDIGVSSMQLDEAGRGFSFQADGPLDMRMGASGPTAADVVATLDAGALAEILYHLGDEHRSRAIARAIVAARTEQPLRTTFDLVRVVTKVLGRGKPGGIHPATRTFQALRIYVNDELGQLAESLSAAERILKPGGRLVVVTFHSLEDRIVKRFLATRGGKVDHGSRHRPQQSIKSEAPSFRIINSRPLTASKGELDVNPRARSARLRAAIRSEAPAWPDDADALEVPRIGR